MPPRILRPASDSPRLALSLFGTAACLVAGYQLGARVFKPDHAHTETTEVIEAPAPEVTPQPALTDAGRAPATTGITPTPAADAGAALVVPVRVAGGVLTGCGDGEETNLPSHQCDNPSGLEAALRARLTAILGTCPSAVSAARDPSKTLSIGLRVDFPRRRAAVLLGRSTSVPEKVNYVACVREALGPLEDVWRMQGAHPRYLYFFAAHFGPLLVGVQPPAAEDGPPAPSSAAPATPAAPAEPATPAAPATEDADAGAAAGPPPDLPTPAALLRMPAMGRATVVWSNALVREYPRNGPVVARVPRDTEVELVDRRGRWWAIRWNNNQVGWTYNDAINTGR